MKSYDSANIRSLALVGHGHSGKTSVAEAIAYLSGLNNRLGSVTDGSSIMDYEPEERDRGGSLANSFLTCEYEGLKIHVIDTPGDGDFIHDATLAMQGVDSAMLVVSAVDGVESMTERMSAAAHELGVGRAIFINKMDHERADYTAVLDDVREVLGVEPVLLHLPIGKGEAFKGVVNLIDQKAYLYEGDSGKPTEAPIPADMADDVQSAVEQMIDAVAMVDDALVEHYLETGSLEPEELRRGLHEGIESGILVPVLLGSATRNIAVDRVLSLSRMLPSVVGRTFAGTNPANGEAIEITGAQEGPFAAICIKTLNDAFMGHVSIMRIVRGSASTESHPTNPRTEAVERFGALLHLNGKKNIPIDRAVAGDIVALPKLKTVETGDTLYEKSAVALAWVTPPPPMISYVVKPMSRADEDKVRGALDKLLGEDKGLIQTFDEVTKEIVLSGRGANHITVTCNRMARRYGVNVELGTPTIPYRETISGTADVRYRHKKQTGGAGQFGEVAIRVFPHKGEGFEFADVTVGGVIPHSLIPSVEKGVRSQLAHGILAGFPVIDVKCELYDGKSHPVDSKDIAFQIAGRHAIRDAVMKAKPILLEPVYQTEVIVPEDVVGDIMGDLNTRRAKIQSMDSRGRNSVVKALVPLAEMLNYAPSLKSITGGKGSYTMQLSSYEPVPASMQDKIVEQVSRITATEDD
ncbi:MAG: elongation factor G [Deltaproteobacteria bacterium]|nr:MAG: elongation factor G [Deltaproteobacteria bacterium]